MRNRVVFIGPVLPFRGGIAQHTTMLSRAMSEEADVLNISFSRQYPQWLFPGESDRDPDYVSHKEKNTEYLIDSLNPLTWIATVKRIKNFKADLVVIPWWTVFWAPCFGYITKALKRKHFNVVFFCHNVVEHEAAWWKSVLTKGVLNNASRFVVHTKDDRKNLLNLVPAAQVSIHSHPIYDQFPAPKGDLKRRRPLELLFYGFVRPYKGLTDLIDSMALLENKDIQLTIAGEFWQGKEETQKKIEYLRLDDQIELRPRYHSDQETAELFDRADIIVLPYRSATGSGVVPIAYHYNKPVIVTRVGGLPDVVEDTKTGFIIEVAQVNQLAELIGTITAKDCKEMVADIVKIKKKLSWSNLSKAIAES